MNDDFGYDPFDELKNAVVLLVAAFSGLLLIGVTLWVVLS